MTTVPVLFGKLALHARDALLRGELPRRSNSQIPHTCRPTMTTEIKNDPARQLIVSMS